MGDVVVVMLGSAAALTTALSCSVVSDSSALPAAVGLPPMLASTSAAARACGSDIWVMVVPIEVPVTRAWSVRAPLALSALM